MFQYVADLITYRVLGLVPETHLAVTVNFFFYDVFKILFLIFVVLAVISFIRTFFVEDKVEKWLGKARFGLGNLIAAVFGAVTPFCSCSSIPVFIGFLKARVPVGIAFSFIITSPLVNEIAFVMMGGLFGWKLAFLYAFSGILLGVVAGMVIGVLKMEKEVILEGGVKNGAEEYLPRTFLGKIEYAFLESKKTFKHLFFYVLGGVALGAVIHGYVPQDFFMDYVGKYNVLAVPVAVLMGIPIYAGCSTLVPFIFSITANGVPLGTSLAFMMSIAGLSLPEAIMLKRIIRWKLLAIFFGIVAAGIILIGYIFNGLWGG